MTIDELQKNFSYDPLTGVIIRLVKHGHRLAGTECGSPATKNKSFRVHFKGKDIPSTRVVWALHTGAFPIDEIDHINRDWCDNRWENLREATHKQNSANRLWKKIEGLPKGVSTTANGNYRVRVCKKYIGTFPTVREATIAYCLEALEKFGDFACLPSIEVQPDV